MQKKSTYIKRFCGSLCFPRAVSLCLVLLGLAACGCCPTHARTAVATQQKVGPRRVPWENVQEINLQVVDDLKIYPHDAEMVSENKNGIAVSRGGRDVRVRMHEQALCLLNF